MKKYLLCLTFLLASFQLCCSQTVLKGKSFKALIGNVCAETNEYNPCASHMIHLVLNFRDQDVIFTEKNVNSCGEDVTSRIQAKWKIDSAGRVALSYSSKIPKGNFLEGFRLQLKGDKLIGYKKDWQNSMVEYKFEKMKE
ncbi:hypothetical protein BBH99_14935 [Chryseobacterium contaminans]|uniref:Lipoprotein n=1 Tax=Chryseobacterium contaminans TaxID=1423959 RepID=A0A1M6ZSK7_9FLAO|nr:hypothetical protein [Chryseobacterium contaminans]OCA69197.1 hypothetical protein BBH99_14935 [Chryseobacterium contaminans]SHL33315.1 hypothetical protein SAMN05444407_103350 [Chryseobacterium contaminans]